MMGFSVVRGIGAFALVVCMAGCAIEPTTQAVLDGYRLIRAGDQAPPSATGLNPAFSYLRVQSGEREVFLVLGYTDPLADGPVQVWYSSRGEVLRLRDGRVVGAIIPSGTNWLNVSFAHLPEWEKVGSQAVFERVRDVSPGYRYGLRESMRIRRIDAPNDTQLRLVPAASLAWFEETVQGATDIPAARYALSTDGRDGAHRVVYAEQCLSSDFCFSWQNWPSLVSIPAK